MPESGGQKETPRARVSQVDVRKEDNGVTAAPATTDTRTAEGGGAGGGGGVLRIPSAAARSRWHKLLAPEEDEEEEEEDDEEEEEEEVEDVKTEVRKVEVEVVEAFEEAAAKATGTGEGTPRRKRRRSNQKKRRINSSRWNKLWILRNKQMVLEINSLVAHFRELLIPIGQPHGHGSDCRELRDKIRKSRRKLIEQCRTARSKIAAKNEESDEYAQLLAAMEVLVVELRKCKNLTLAFPIHDFDHGEQEEGFLYKLANKLKQNM